MLIGTDATHAEHIETIKSRLYVGEGLDRKFVPGELGMGLVEGTRFLCLKYRNVKYLTNLDRH